jgi:hypothetical protein
MNILLLTPDAVGGTLLMKTLTIYMQFHEFNRPVIDVGHLELGLEKNYSPDFNQEIVYHDPKHKKFQTLTEIIDLLNSVDHYKIAKLPHYNILSRKDPRDQLLPFYQYLKENYFVISCRRENIFEHALSWSLNKITNGLNVYSTKDKIEKFAYFYKNKVNIDPTSIIQSLEDYKKYIQWCQDHFKVASYYSYEKHSKDIENYILSLPVFAGQKKLNRWKDVYNQEFNDWNRCHYFLGDLTPLIFDNNKISLALPDFSIDEVPQVSNEEITKEMMESWQKFVNEYQGIADPSWPKLEKFEDYNMLPEHIKDECRNTHHITWELDMVQKKINMLQDKYTRPAAGSAIINQRQNNSEKLENYLAEQHINFLSQHREQYQLAAESINKMKTIGILQSTIPIKKQTLIEKKFIIKNFDECLDAYNKWITRNPECGSVINDKELLVYHDSEQQFWNSINHKVLSIGQD